MSFAGIMARRCRRRRPKGERIAGKESDGARRKAGRGGERTHNPIVTRTSSTCFHNYDLFKIRIDTRGESRAIVAEHAIATTNPLANR